MIAPLQLGQYCGVSVRRREFADLTFTENRFAPGLEIGLHSHQVPHFTAILRGGFTETYAQTKLECTAGRTLIVPALLRHSDSVGSEGAMSLSVEFSSSFTQRIDSHLDLLSQPSVHHHPLLQRAARRLYREFRTDDSASPLALECLTLEVLVTCSRLNPGSQATPRNLQRVKEVLHDRFRENLSLAELAAIAQFHPTHMARQFRREFGCTIGEYVRGMRLEHAARALRTSSQSIAEIALDAGFFDQSHFSRQFREAFGASPSDYRRQSR